MILTEMETLFSGIERLNNHLFKKRCMEEYEVGKFLINGCYKK